MTNKNSFQTIKILPLILIVLLAGSRSSFADETKFLTKEFVASIAAINGDYFFKPKVPSPYDPKMIGLPTQNINVEMAAQAMSKREHYEALGKKLCAPIAKGYASVFNKKINGKNAYDFDQELTAVMSAAGAYILPLIGTDGKFEAEYKIDNSAAFETQYGLLPSERRLRLSRGEGGKLNFKAAMHPLGGSYIKFVKFYEIMNAYKPYQELQFNYDFHLTRSYLFTFDNNASKDLNDPDQENVFFYVNLPYEISGNARGNIESINRNPEDKVRCEVLSKSGLFVMGLTSTAAFVEKGIPLAPIVPVEPLTIPLHEDYGRRQVRRADGSSGFMQNDNGYLIAADDVSDPSLQCWMLAFGFDDGDIHACKNQQYADHFIEMLNHNICVWQNKTTRSPVFTYPYKVNPGVFQQPDVPGPGNFTSRCENQ